MDELGHVLLPVTSVTAGNVVDKLARPPAAVGVGELEGPEGVGDLLKVGSAGDDFVNDVFETFMSVLRLVSPCSSSSILHRDACPVLLGLSPPNDPIPPNLTEEINVQMIPYLPNNFSMMALSVMGIRWPSTLA